MTHAPEYLATMCKLIPMIREVPKFSFWDFETLCDWFSYFWNRGTISFQIEGENAKGVCAIKLFSRLEQFLEPFVHEPKGDFCMVDVLVADGPEAIAFSFHELFKRWGPGRVMLWDRGARTEGGAPRMYLWKDYLKLTRRLTKGAVVYG